MAQLSREKSVKNRSLFVWFLIIIMGVLSALAVYSFLSASNKTVEVLVAATDIPQYTKLSASGGQVKVVEIQKDTYNTLTEGQKNVYLKPSDIDGFYAEVAIKKGELIYKDKVVDPINGRYVAQLYEKPNWKLVTIKVNAINSGAAQLAPGDFIDIYYQEEIEDEKFLIDNPDLKNIRVVDIKYGKNYFQTTTNNTDDKGTVEKEEKSSSTDVGNINNILGDEAAIILSVPSYKAALLIDNILKDVSFYITATKPPIFHAKLDGSDGEYKPILISDIQLPTAEGSEFYSDDETSTAGIGYNEFNSIKIFPEYKTSDKKAVMSYIGNTSEIQFMVNNEISDKFEFLNEYRNGSTDPNVNFTYVDNPDKNYPRIKIIKTLNIFTQ